jgi:hypothetical protein
MPFLDVTHAYFRGERIEALSAERDVEVLAK